MLCKNDSFHSTKILFLQLLECYNYLLGGRAGSSKALIIVTDDKSSGKEPVKEAVKPLQDKGVRIYVVNIGSKPDEEETKDIVPDENNVMTPKTTDDVPSLSAGLVQKITDDVNNRKFWLYLSSNNIF